MLIDELPHPHASRVETEINAGSEIEDDAFAVELPKDDVVAHFQRRVQRKIGHGGSVTYAHMGVFAADQRIELRIWIFAAAVRLLYLAAARPPFSLYNWEAASNLLLDGTLSLDRVKTAALEPLYPLFLATGQLLVGPRPLLVQAVQALVASAGAVYLYKLGSALTLNKRVGIAAATLFAVYPLLVRHSIDGTESALLTTLLIAFAYQFVTMHTTMDAAAVGGWLGLAILTRTVALPLLLVAPMAAAAQSGRRAIAMAGVAVLLLMPSAIRNYTLNGAIVPARAGVNLFIANSEYAPGVIADYGPDILLPYAESRIADVVPPEVTWTPEIEQRQDAAFRRLALAEIRQRPLDTLRLKIRNVFTFFSPVLTPHREITAATEIRLGEEGRSIVVDSIARPLSYRVIYTVSYSAVIALAVVGVYKRRHDLATDAILWWIVLTFAAVHAVLFPAPRYRVPVDFVFLFYAAVGVAGTRSAIIRRK